MLEFEVVGELQMRRETCGLLMRTHTKAHYLEADTHDDAYGFDLVEKNARMRLKRDNGWICSWT